jgi:hypothetical protein
MENKTVHVPDEDALIESVLEGKVDDMLQHLEQCPSCAEIVKDIQAVTQGLQAIESEEPPRLSMEQFSPGRENKKQVSWLETLACGWYRNPVVLSVGFVVFIVCMYILIAYVFK